MPDTYQSEHRTFERPVVEISLTDIARSLAAQRKKIFTATAATTLAAIALSFLMPKKYEATTVILPPQQNASMASMLMGGLAGSALSGLASGGGLSLKNPNDMYAGLFRSRSVEDGVIQAQNLYAVYKDKLQSDVRNDLERNTAIDSSAKDNLIHITVTDRSPQRAADVANAYIAQYRKLSAGLALTEGGQRRKFFEMQIADTKENLVKAEDALSSQQQASGVLEPTAQGQVVIQTAAQLRAQIAAKEVALRGLQTYATNENAAVQQAQQEIAALNAELARVTKGQSDDTLLTQAKAPKAALEYARKLRDVKYYQSVYEFLAKEAEVARLDEAREGTTIQVVDVATPPDKKSSPRRALIAALGLALGFLGSSTYLAFGAVRRIYRQAEREHSPSLVRQQV